MVMYVGIYGCEVSPRLTRRSLIQSCKYTSQSHAAFFIHLHLHLTSYSSLDSHCYDLIYNQTSIHADCWYPSILPCSPCISLCAVKNQKQHFNDPPSRCSKTHPIPDAHAPVIHNLIRILHNNASHNLRLHPC
jgi:hypothetical protein